MHSEPPYQNDLYPKLMALDTALIDMCQRLSIYTPHTNNIFHLENHVRWKIRLNSIFGHHLDNLHKRKKQTAEHSIQPEHSIQLESPSELENKILLFYFEVVFFNLYLSTATINDCPYVVYLKEHLDKANTIFQTHNNNMGIPEPILTPEKFKENNKDIEISEDDQKKINFCLSSDIAKIANENFSKKDEAINNKYNTIRTQNTPETNKPETNKNVKVTTEIGTTAQNEEKTNQNNVSERSNSKEVNLDAETTALVAKSDCTPYFKLGLAGIGLALGIGACITGVGALVGAPLIIGSLSVLAGALTVSTGGLLSIGSGGFLGYKAFSYFGRTHEPVAHTEERTLNNS